MVSGRKEVNGFLEKLRSILCSDSFNSDRDDSHPPLLFVFGKMIEGRTVYIKLKIKSEKKKVVCVSFHYAKHDMNYPYR